MLPPRALDHVSNVGNSVVKTPLTLFADNFGTRLNQQAHENFKSAAVLESSLPKVSEVDARGDFFNRIVGGS